MAFWQFVDLVVLGATLILVSAEDLKSRTIPTRVLLMCAVVHLFCQLAQSLQATSSGAAVSPFSTLFAVGWAAVVFGALVFIGAACQALGASSMGGGDVKLFTLLALYLAPAPLLITMLMSCLLGIAWAASSKLMQVLRSRSCPGASPQGASEGMPTQSLQGFISVSFPWAPSISVAAIFVLVLTPYLNVLSIIDMNLSFFDKSILNNNM